MGPGKSAPPSSNKQPDTQKINSPTVSCPQQTNTRTPCDVASLKVADGASGRSLEITKSRVTELAPKDAPFPTMMRLHRYDAVLELLSSYKTYGGNDENAQKKNIKLNITPVLVGQCPLNKHLSVKVVPLNSSDKEDGKEWVNTNPSTVKILARPHTERSFGQWIAPFWSFGEEHVKQLAVLAESCGVLTSGKPNRALTCLVRVYRDDVYKLTFQIPAFIKIKREKKADINRKGTVTRESSYERSIFGDKVAEESHKTTRGAGASSQNTSTSSKYGGMDKQGNYYTQEYERGIKDGVAHIERTSERTERSGAALLYRGESTEKITSTKTVAKGAQFVFEVEAQKQIKPKVSLKRNGDEVDFTKTLNDLINLQKLLTESLNEIKKWVPKVGWWIDVELSLMTGEIEGSWGSRYPKTPKDGERYKLVEQFYDIDFKLKLLDFSVSLGAGIDFSTSGALDWFVGGKAFEFILKAEGKLTCEVTVNKTLTSSTESKATEVNGEGKADIYLQGQVTVLAVTYGAKGGVKGGLEFKGSLIGSFLVPPQVDGKFGFIETKLYVELIDGVREREETFEVVIFNKKDIWQGKLPSTV